MTFSPLSLEIWILCLGIFMLMFEAFSPRASKSFVGACGVIGLLVVFVATFFLREPAAEYVKNGFYVLDAPALFFKRLVLVATGLSLLMGIDYQAIFSRYVPAEREGAGLGEFFALPVFACAGLMWMVSALDFVMIFVSLELATISFYILVASMRRNKNSLEAGAKYLVLGALSTGFLVFGVAWIFGMTGSTNLNTISELLPSIVPEGEMGLLFGLGLVMVALFFKVGVVPFQFWIPDTYQGAPTPVTALLSVGSKAAGFVVLWRVLGAFMVVPLFATKLIGVVVVAAVATLLYGNLVALVQTNFKRLMAYSSIGHAGFLLMGLGAALGGNALGAVAIEFYFGAYLLMTFAAFFALVVIMRATGGEEIADFNGLGKRSPFLSIMVLMAMASLAGVPFTVGFMAKLFIFQAAWAQGLYVLVGVGVVAVACGFYYYFQVIRAMYWVESAEGAAAIKVPLVSRVVIYILVAAIGLFGFFPGLLMRVVN